MSIDRVCERCQVKAPADAFRDDDGWSLKCAPCRRLLAGAHGPAIDRLAKARGYMGPTTQTPDHVNAPAHYTRLDPQPIDVIERWGLGFHEGQVVKYLARAGHKGEAVVCLKKARFYLDRLIAKRQAAAKDVEREAEEKMRGSLHCFQRGQCVTPNGGACWCACGGCGGEREAVRLGHK